ncbi:MAG: SMP-30/gluconolactonase/LRE family protein [Novosphingobium sp.]|nr:SMP-30/gluconolactonase/LRE family protein [Novosphingobium sp.]MCP5404432.1 SMP-30/gluconolactonase/LRE family protein [Novosphingobium sp.]
MAQQAPRDRLASVASTAEGWTVQRLTQPSRLNGANGIRTGADGRIYVAQVAGSKVSAVDPDTGEIETVSPTGGAIIGPDDLVFDDDGNLYCTEITEGRVRMLAPNGESKVIWDDMPVANPITYHQGHLIAGELRVGGRIMELDRNGGAPRVILDNVPMANAFEVGPDGKLYFPAQGANEIWRVSLDGGEPEVVAKDLGVPDSVKFDPQGFIVSTQVGSGQVLRIDPRTGDKTVLADIGPGLDNCTFVGDRLFVSHITGGLFEILAQGNVRALVEKGFQWPMGLAVDGEGTVCIADGMFAYTLRPGGRPEQAGMLFAGNYPGFMRGLACSDTGDWFTTTANGTVSRWVPGTEPELLASGGELLMGIALAPGGAVVFADAGAGRVLSAEGGEVSELASGLDRPTGVAVASDGTVYVSLPGEGRIAKIAGGRAETFVDGLGEPQGIAIRGGKLYAVDNGAKAVIECDLASGAQQTLASDLAVGVPQGVTPLRLGGVGDMCGPMWPFTGIAAGADGALYVSGDLEGSVLALRPA